MNPAASRVPPSRPLSSGDGWVHDGEGRRFWGLYGAAGLLVFHPEAGVLLQHRALWSHFGGTWGIPGGARHEGESAQDAAAREAGEEAGVPGDLLSLRFCSIVDLGMWSYTTVAAAASKPFEPTISDPESLELRWVPVAEVDELELHPGFAAAWPALRQDLTTSVNVIVDSANVVGSRPDGWWRDRAGATERLAQALDAWSLRGLDARELDLRHDHWFPRVTLVLEGKARDAQVASSRVDVVLSPADGDSTIVSTVDGLLREALAGPVLVITADRELQDTVSRLGAAVRTPGWLWDQLDAAHSE